MILSSAAIGSARVIVASVTSLVKVSLWVVVARPSVALAVRVCAPFSSLKNVSPVTAKVLFPPRLAENVRSVTPSMASVTVTGSPSSSFTL